VKPSGFWTISAFVLVADQWTKHLVNKYLDYPVPVIPGVLSLTHVKNPGTAFGLFGYGGPYLTAVAIGAAIFIVGYWFYLQGQPEKPSNWLLFGLALPLGGALGNLVDRIRFGKVTDFIDLHVWPVFNVADTAITIGAFLVAYYFFFIHERPAPAEVRAPVAEPTAD
jgi:signal peptidase II